MVTQLGLLAVALLC